MQITLRAAGRGELAQLQAIELAAFATLRAAGAVTGPATASSLEALERYQQGGYLFVACTPQGEACGFIAGERKEKWLHIAEMDVHPAWQRRGIGRRLVAHLIQLAQQQGLDGVSLTTDRLAAFNAPFYASLGFAPLAARQGPAWLQAILACEVEAGFNPARRVAMIYRC